MHKNYYILQQFSLYRNLVQAISTRALGDMEFARGSQENGRHRAQFANLLNVPAEQFVKMEQVHGARIAVVGKRDTAPFDSDECVPGVDGMITKEKGVFLVAKTADCLPVLYFDPKLRVLGLAHAGWRGVVGKLPALMVAAMQREFGSQPEQIVVGIGPCLSAAHNVMPLPAVQQYLPEWEDFYEVRPDKTVSVDLVGFAVKQLQEVGIAEANIDVGGICTAEEAAEFYSASARGEQQRFMTIIGLRNFAPDTVTG